MPEHRVVVIGGGITGLAAAHRLTTAGVEVTLLEESERLGGKIHSRHANGALVEAGPDSFVAGKGSVVDLAVELGMAEQLIPSMAANRGTFIWWEGRMLPLPEGMFLMAPSRLGPVLRSELLSWSGKLRMLADLGLPRRREPGDESLGAFVSRRMGRQILDRIAEPMIAGIHAAEPDTMSLEAAFPRFRKMEREHRSLILAARRAPVGPGNGMSYFASFRSGMSSLTDALVGALTGADMRVGIGARAITPIDHGHRITLSDDSELFAAAVVLAVPAASAATLLTTLAPAAAMAISGIGQVSTSVVTLGYRATQLRPLSGYGFVVPSAQGRSILGATYTTRKWEGRAADPGQVLIRVYIGGIRHPQLPLSPGPELIDIARAELSELAGIEANPELATVDTWEGGLHAYTMGHLERVAAAETALASTPGLHLAGAAFHGIGLNECVDSGRRAADSILKAMASPRLAVGR